MLDMDAILGFNTNETKENVTNVNAKENVTNGETVIVNESNPLSGFEDAMNQIGNTVFEAIPVGEYIVQVEGFKIKKSTNGNPIVVLTTKVIDGESHINKYEWITYNVYKKDGTFNVMALGDVTKFISLALELDETKAKEAFVNMYKKFDDGNCVEQKFDEYFKNKQIRITKTLTGATDNFEGFSNYKLQAV